MRIDSNCQAKGVDRARSEAVLDQLGGGCTAAQFAKMKRAQREPKIVEKEEGVLLFEVITYCTLAAPHTSLHL